jgi:hypothetical protein
LQMNVAATYHMKHKRGHLLILIFSDHHQAIYMAFLR